MTRHLQADHRKYSPMSDDTPTYLAMPLHIHNGVDLGIKSVTANKRCLEFPFPSQQGTFSPRRPVPAFAISISSITRRQSSKDDGRAYGMEDSQKLPGQPLGPLKAFCQPLRTRTNVWTWCSYVDEPLSRNNLMPGLAGKTMELEYPAVYPRSNFGMFQWYVKPPPCPSYMLSVRGLMHQFLPRPCSLSHIFPSKM